MHFNMHKNTYAIILETFFTYFHILRLSYNGVRQNAKNPVSGALADTMYASRELG